MSEYRINYGQGQVSNSRSTKKDILRDYWNHVDYDHRWGQSSAGMFIERDTEDGWVRCSIPERSEPRA